MTEEMGMAPELVDLMIWREDGKWVGEGVYYDIGTQADTFDAAVEQLEITAGIELWEYRVNRRGPMATRQWRRPPEGRHVIRLTISTVPIEPPRMGMLP